MKEALLSQAEVAGKVGRGYVSGRNVVKLLSVPKLYDSTAVTIALICIREYQTRTATLNSMRCLRGSQWRASSI